MRFEAISRGVARAEHSFSRVKAGKLVALPNAGAATAPSTQPRPRNWRAIACLSVRQAQQPSTPAGTRTLIERDAHDPEAEGPRTIVTVKIGESRHEAFLHDIEHGVAVIDLPAHEAMNGSAIALDQRTIGIVSTTNSPLHQCPIIGLDFGSAFHAHRSGARQRACIGRERAHTDFLGPCCRKFSRVEIVVTTMPGMSNHQSMKIVGFKSALAADGKTLSITLPRALPIGSYQVSWHAVARDGQPLKGRYAF